MIHFDFELISRSERHETSRQEVKGEFGRLLLLAVLSLIAGVLMMFGSLNL